VLEPGLIHMAERWRDRAALQAHFTTPHIAAWRAVLAQIEASDRNILSYETDQAEPI
jgi:quinol monooxygenase YgiN